MNFPKINFQDPKIRTSAMIIAAIILGIYMWYSRVLTPKLEHLSIIKNDLRTSQAKLNNILKMKSQLSQLKADIAAKQLVLDSLKSIFPDQKEIPKLIHEITRHSLSSGIYTTKFIPLEDQVREYYVENNYNIALLGGYHQFAEFLSKLASLKLIINLSEMKIVAIPQNIEELTGGDGEAFSINANFKLTTFSSKN